jgi:GntP family gluconate:H+ symporter
MHPLWILSVGVVIVIGGILVLRLHAFLALVLAALVVAALTPLAAVERFGIDKSAVKIHSQGATRNEVVLKLDSKQSRPGMQYLALRADEATGELKQAAVLQIRNFTEFIDKDGEKHELAIAVADKPVYSDDIIIHPLALRAAKSTAKQTIGERVAAAFGSTCAQIGILIAMAAIIGKCLLDSGSADRIVRSALKLVGERGAPGAFVGSGFLLGIPVFFDTVFYLMVPLGKALRMRTGRNYLLYVLSIVAGATMAHSLVPPTPGPLFVAEALKVDMGLMILAGCIVGLFSSTMGYTFARIVNSRTEVPLRESPDFTAKDMEELMNRGDDELPPLVLAMLPILLPVVLIAGYTILDSSGLKLSDQQKQIAEALGNKNIALVVAAAIAMLTLVWHKRTSLKELADSVQAALSSGGVIILITSAGGAFGAMLQQTGVASLIRDLPQSSPAVVVTLAFLITMAIRTAQGSATVAMITAVGVLSGLADELPFHPVYLALAIGCGSKPLAWMNDSGFWVICKMSGMTETEGLKFVTPMSLLMGLAGLGATLVGVIFFPLT